MHWRSMNYHDTDSQSGFTLIELVSVMVLLGVLAVSAIPSFTGSDDFSAYSAQDQIITGARMAQHRAMYDTSGASCYHLNITGTKISVRSIVGDASSQLGPTEEWRNGIDVDPSVVLGGIDVFFDSLGNAIQGCGGLQNTGNVSISIGAALNVCINPVGYVDAC